MSDYCTDTVPVLLRRATFCRAFAADAKDFRAYNSWVRAQYLGIMVLKFSEVLSTFSPQPWKLARAYYIGMHTVALVEQPETVAS